MPTKAKTAEEPTTVEAVDPVAQVLALEDALRAAADDYPSGDNSDAVKSAIRNAVHGIAHIRKVQKANAAVAR